jgi:hypothetical protein
MARAWPRNWRAMAGGHTSHGRLSRFPVPLTTRIQTLRFVSWKDRSAHHAPAGFLLFLSTMPASLL